MQDLKLNKTLLFINALVPLMLLMWDGAHYQLGVNPIEFLTRIFGVLTLIFILITLMITPLRKLFGWGFLIKYRRMLGLFAFFTAVYTWLLILALTEAGAYQAQWRT